MRTARVIALLVVISALVLSYPGTMSVSQASPVPCLLLFPSFAVTCYPPSDVARATARMRVPPLDPTVTVQQVLGLSLTQVISLDRFLPREKKRPKYSHGVLYIYGTLPGPPGLIPYPSPASPPWLLLTESVGHLKGIHGIRMSRPVSVSGQAGSPVTTTTYGNWGGSVNIPHHDLSLAFEGNEDRPLLKRVITAIIYQTTPSSSLPTSK